jgi:hypothetical protein
MKLIDADKLIEELEETNQALKDEIKNARTCIQKKVYEAQLFTALEIIRIIKEEPTAFDVDKVISNIWDRSELIHIKHNCYDEVEDYIRVTDASEIVKAGGIDE